MSKQGDWFWHELNTTDADGAKAFYGKLLGWAWDEMDMGEYTYHIIKHGEGAHGGLVKMQGEQLKDAPPHWMIYVRVDDVDAAAKKTKDLGGVVHVEPFDIPKVGRMAVVADPQGAAFSIMKPADG